MTSSERFILLVLLLRKSDYIGHDYILQKGLARDIEYYSQYPKNWDWLISQKLNISKVKFKLCFGNIYNINGLKLNKAFNDSRENEDDVEIKNKIQEILKEQNITQEEYEQEIAKQEKIKQKKLQDEITKKEAKVQREIARNKMQALHQKLREEERLKRAKIRREKSAEMEERRVMNEKRALQKKVKEEEERLRKEQIKREKETEKQRLLIALENVLQGNFLYADELYITQCNRLINLNEYQLMKHNFVKKWANDNGRIPPEIIQRDRTDVW